MAGIIRRLFAANGLDNNSKTIQNVADPSNAQDAATKSYCTNASNLASGTVPAARGGTGVANGANNTITFTGNYTLGATLTGNTAVTFPTSGLLATSTKLSVYTHALAVVSVDISSGYLPILNHATATINVPLS